MAVKPRDQFFWPSSSNTREEEKTCVAKIQFEFTLVNLDAVHWATQQHIRCCSVAATLSAVALHSALHSSLESKDSKHEPTALEPSASQAVKQQKARGDSNLKSNNGKLSSSRDCMWLDLHKPANIIKHWLTCPAAFEAKQQQIEFQLWRHQPTTRLSLTFFKLRAIISLLMKTPALVLRSSLSE